MAELLIRLKNNTHSDPAKDRMCYKRGDIVVVKPDGHHWGRAEGLPDFAVIGTDRTVAQVEHLLDIHTTPQPHTEEIPSTEWIKMQANGKYRMFTAKPKAGGIRLIKKGGKTIPLITLTGMVDEPHTRRKWRLHLNLIPAHLKKRLLTAGRASVPFSKLSMAMKDKITGAKA